MHMVRHHNKPDTNAAMFCQAGAKMTDDDPLGLIGIEQSTTFITRECDKVGMLFVIVNSSSHGAFR